jgi:hypothetical protein
MKKDQISRMEPNSPFFTTLDHIPLSRVPGECKGFSSFHAPGHSRLGVSNNHHSTKRNQSNLALFLQSYFSHNGAPLPHTNRMLGMKGAWSATTPEVPLPLCVMAKSMGGSTLSRPGSSTAK